MNTDDFSSPDTLFEEQAEEETIRIKIIGVGGAGNNAVDRLKLQNLTHVHLAAVNTDSQTIASSPVEEKAAIGRSLTRGLGSGGEAEIGREAAEADHHLLRRMVSGVDLVFLLAGLGGGTGSGAAPVLASLAEEEGALVIAFVTLPFTFEGARRVKQADDSLAELRKICHAVIPLPNNLLLQESDDNASVLDAFALADEWISKGVRAIWSMLFQTGLINVDFGALRRAFTSRGGKTLFGFGEARGEDYTARALDQLMLCPLLHTPEFSRRADSLIVNITGGPDLSMSQVNEIMAAVTDKFGSKDNTLMGAVIDGTMRQSLAICVLGATDIGAGKPACGQGRQVLSRGGPKSSAAKSPSKQSGSSAPGKIRQNEFAFSQDDEQRGFFEDTDRNLHEGEDLDVPAYLRRGLRVRI